MPKADRRSSKGRTQARRAGLACLVLPLLLACGSTASTTAGPNVGGRAPDFYLPSLDGSNLALADLRGSVVLINLWATWCPPCRNEIPILEAAYQAHKGDGLIVLGISIGEAPEVVRPFVAEMGITYPVLIDERSSMLDRLRALGLPVSVIVDREGVVRVRHSGELSKRKLDEYLGALLH